MAFAFGIPTGATGATGTTGTAATIAAGTTTTGSAGTNAAVSNAGSSSAATFNFTIPRGDTGVQGPTGETGADGSITSVAIAGQTNSGIAVSGSPLTSSGTITLDVTSATLRTKINVEDGATADQTNAEIRTAVEAATDSNVFTDVDHTLLNSLSGVEASADVTDATNVNAAGAVMESDSSTSSMSFVIDDDTMGTASATKLASSESIKAYVDAEVVGLLDYKGGYNASTNSPDLDTDPSAIKKGDVYTVTHAGTFFSSTALEIGDVLIAEQDDPDEEANWTVVNKDLTGAIMHSDIPDSDTGFVKRTGSSTYDIDTATYSSEGNTIALAVAL